MDGSRAAPGKMCRVEGLRAFSLTQSAARSIVIAVLDVMVVASASMSMQAYAHITCFNNPLGLAERGPKHYRWRAFRR